MNSPARSIHAKTGTSNDVPVFALPAARTPPTDYDPRRTGAGDRCFAEKTDQNVTTFGAPPKLAKVAVASLK